jgi:hypothetical protein
VTKSVDRLELVADEEHFRVRPAQEIHEVALQAVRVLELVDHDRSEPQAFALADLRVVTQQITGVQLQVLEIERGFPRLRLRV